MKNKKSAKSRKAWKIIAVAVVVVFAVFIVGGMVKHRRVMESFVKATPEQLTLAESIAREKLESAGANLSEFQLNSPGRARVANEGGTERMLIPVTFYSNATTHTYLVDAASGELVMHTQTDMYINIWGCRGEPRNYHGLPPPRGENPGCNGWQEEGESRK